MKRINLFFLSIIVIALTACTKGSPQAVLQSISFSDKTVSLLVGQPKQLTPVFTPKTFDVIPVEWSSSDAAVVTVSPTGYVLASGIGEATITIKDKNSATNGKVKIIVK